MTGNLCSAGIIGWPVAHSKSPLIYRFWLEALGRDGDYGRFAVHPDALGRAVAALPALGLSGVNVTVPHKVTVIPHLDDVEGVAKLVGAVNLVTVEGGRLIGRNTDVDGVLEALPAAVLPAGGRAVLIGNGGAARAALAAFSTRQVAEVRMVARNPAKAEALLAEFGLAGRVVAFAEAATAFAGAQAIVNATSLGMHGADPMPDAVLAALPAAAPGARVMDMVYAPLDTPLLVAASAAGLDPVDGLAMLIGQAVSTFAHLFAGDAPRDRDGELRRRLLA